MEKDMELELTNSNYYTKFGNLISKNGDTYDGQWLEGNENGIGLIK